MPEGDIWDLEVLFRMLSLQGMRLECLWVYECSILHHLVINIGLYEISFRILHLLLNRGVRLLSELPLALVMRIMTVHFGRLLPGLAALPLLLVYRLAAVSDA